jgi:peptidoglycan/xylan/chitin deacetylase (PgdA/CDA1 family)
MDYTSFLSAEKCAIFLFHGVIEKSEYDVRNYTRKHLERDHFYRVLRALVQAGTPVRMDDIVEHYVTREPFPTHSFAVTFDDGFENNCSVAAPILSDLSIPATFYISTAFIEHGTMSWIDRIEHCLEHAPQGSLRFSWDQASHGFHDRASKIALLDYLRSRVKKDASIDLEELVQEVFTQCGIETVDATDEPLDRKLSWDQVARLHADSLFTIGGHSHNHLNLAFLTTDQAEQEVSTNLHLLDAHAGIRTNHYSYPEGLDYCYSGETIQILKRHGITCCPTAIEGVNDVRQDPFHLRRIAVV